MTDYANSVKQSLSRLDDDEILEKIKSNSLTDEAKEVAQKILLERGLDVNNPDSLRRIEPPAPSDFTERSSVKRGFRTANVMIWIATLFLLGVSQHVNIPNASQHSPAAIVMKFVMGLSWALIGGSIVAIYSYIKRNNIVTIGEIVRKYRSNITTIIIINIVIGSLISFQVFTSYSSIVAVLDVMIIFGLTLAIFKRIKSAKIFLAFYAFINPVAVTLLGGSGVSGFLWSFVFLATAQSILIEDTFNKIEHSLEV